MNQLERYAVSLDSLEGLRARLAKYEDADGKPITILAGHTKRISELEGALAWHEERRLEADEQASELSELKAWKAEEMAVMTPLIDYAHSVCTASLGCSLTDWLVSDHKQMITTIAEQAREIAWLREHKNEYMDAAEVTKNALLAELAAPSAGSQGQGE